MFINHENLGAVPVMSAAQKPKLRYRTVVISDTHLGKGAAAADCLLEFLQHVDCERLILAGDIVEGWGLKSKKRKPLQEMHARCIDGINALAARGVEVIYLRGNHDEDLAKSRYGLMRRTIDFHDKSRILHAPITFAKSIVHTDAKGINHLVIHGDVFDRYQKEEGKKRIAKLADRAYEGLVTLNRVFKKAVMNTTGADVSPASYLKSATKEIVGVISDFERSVVKPSIVKRFGGVICGHIHHAEIRKIGKVSYMNSGDWVEGCRCLAEKADGSWEIIDWATKRRTLGLTSLPKVTDENPFAAFRPVTERQIGLIRRVWPGKNYGDLLAERRELRAEVSDIRADISRAAGNDDGGDNARRLSRLNRKLAKRESAVADLRDRLQPVAKM